MRNLLILAAATAFLAVSGCSGPRLPTRDDVPLVHKIDVQQGNVVTQDMIAQLRKGMDKKKVQFVMGTPIVHDTFNAHRWDYVYTFKPGGGGTQRRRVTLVFVDDALDHLEGDIVPAAGELAYSSYQDTTVDVPRYRRKGLVERLTDKIPFTEPATEESDEDAEPTEAELEARAEIEAEKQAGPVPQGPLSAATGVTLGPGEGVVVPPDAPTRRKKKGWFRSLLDGIGIGADDDEEDGDYDPGQPGYRDITDQSEI